MSEPGFIDPRALFEVFLAETTERLDEVEAILIRRESHPEDEEELSALFRAMHTLKGDAITVGLLRLGELAHLAEDLLDQIRAGTRRLADREANLLFRLVDTARAVLANAGAGRPEEEPAELADLIAALKALAQGEPEAPMADAHPAPEMARELPSEALGTLRVPLAKLDRLLDLAGEITLAREQLRQLLATAGREAQLARTALEETDPLYLELQELVMNARLQPLGPVLRQQVRIVRDVGAACGKAARLVVEDRGVEVDTRVIEQLRAPLAHLVRNAVDHGLELPEARRAAGKDPVGTITLSARQEAGRVVVEVADDGAGLERERIVARAVALGLLPPGAAPPEREVWRLLFHAGFSTTETVTEISGRGVGLDIVQKGVEALKGTVDIDSRRSAGTTVAIRVPLTVAILEGFTVGVGSEAYVLPLETVLGCRDLPASGNGAAEAPEGVLDLDGGALPYLRLGHFFDCPKAAGGRESVVVVRRGEERAGLVVDHLYGGTQTVVKPLPPGLPVHAGFSGTAVLGDGRVAMILDVAALFGRFLADGAGAGGLRPRRGEGASA